MESGLVSWNVLAVFSVCNRGTFVRVSFYMYSYSRALASTCTGTVGFAQLESDGSPFHVWLVQKSEYM